MDSVVVGIKKAMAAKGLYQKAVAERSGFTDQQFSDMLNGRKIIRAEYLPQIAKALGINIGDLFANGSDEPGQKGA